MPTEPELALAPIYCPATTSRCKRQNFTQKWSSIFTALTYEGFFRVCYRHNQGIVTVLARHGDATQVQYPWTWRGNAAGYPKHYRFAKYVDFYFRGQLDYCLFQYGCLGTKWPYITIRFNDNNTMSRIDVGVG